MGKLHKNLFLDMLYEKFGREATCVGIVESLAEDGSAFRDEIKFNRIHEIMKRIQEKSDGKERGDRSAIKV